MRLNQMHQHFRVGVTLEDMPGFGQRLLQPDVVLDNAVVDQRDPPGAVGMGMRVDIVRSAVGGPARVRDHRAARFVQPVQRRF